jgi:hypothetical protein
MELDAYIKASSGWLVDVTICFDMASAAALASDPKWTPPPHSTAADGPYLVSGTSSLFLAKALPLVIKTSKEAMRAAWVAVGDMPQGSNADSVRVPHADGRGPRIEGVLARTGIITQFELWKSYASQFPGYPTNLKAARNYQFSTTAEADIVTGMIELRNTLTHEVDVRTDPTLRRLVDYAWECQHIAKWMTALYASKDASTAPPAVT